MIAQQAYLKLVAVGTIQAGDEFGNPVAVSGDTVLVGAAGECIHRLLNDVRVCMNRLHQGINGPDKRTIPPIGGVNNRIFFLANARKLSISLHCREKLVVPTAFFGPHRLTQPIQHSMQFKELSKLTSCVLTLALSVVASHAALTTSNLGLGGTATGDTTNATGPVTLSNTTATGDMWDGGDEAVFLHETSRITGSFSATVRVIGQTEAANGRWGKGGIMARNDLTTTSSFAMVQAAAGNGSQPGMPEQVPIRLAGRRVHGSLLDMYEDPAGASPNSNDIFRTDGGVNMTWLRLDYDAPTNGFTAGFAPDVGGAPGAWTFSATRTDVIDTNPADGWMVGLVYSAHADMSLAAGEGLHGITFDNFRIIPEPSTALLGSAVAGVLALRRRRRR